MKKIILFILIFNSLSAFPPTNPYFDNLLSDNGKITKNTLKVKKTGDYATYFDGDITLTGVIERSDNYEYGDINSELRFYPDKNIDLPFLYSVYNAKDNKKFERLNFGVFLFYKNINMPEPLNKRFFGVSAVRAEVTIRDYHFYGEGDAGRDAYGHLVSFKLLGDIKTQYFTKNYLGDYTKLEYNSKDDYINIRDKENGKIIGKILKKDMVNNEGVLLYINGDGIDYINLENFEKKWFEVFYLPPNANNGKDAIHGFVHGSQIKFEDM